MTSNILGVVFFRLPTSPSGQPLIHAALPSLNSNRHFHLPKRILAHKVRIALVDTLHENISVWHARVREQEEFGSRKRLEHGQTEE